MADSKDTKQPPAAGTGGGSNTGPAEDPKAFNTAYDSQFAASLHLEPTETKKLDDLVISLKSVLSTLPDYKELRVGGSFAKGTAVKGASRDVDAVVMFDGGKFNPSDEKQFKDRLALIEAKLTQHTTSSQAVTKVETKRWLVKCEVGDVSFDILVGAITKDTALDSIAFVDKFGPMKDATERKRWSGSVSYLQTKFVKCQPAVVLDTIRMAKWWRDCYKKWEEKDVGGKPVSYMIELLVIWASKRVQTDKLTTETLFRHFLEVCCTKSLHIVFTEYTTSKFDWSKIPPCDELPWKIVDVANPTNLVNWQFKNPKQMEVLQLFATKTLNALPTVKS